MRKEYLGDSYDLVKRFWRESLEPIAPLYAYPRFVPAEIRARYTTATSIPVHPRPPGRFGILLDPHTGIPLPDESLNGATASHSTLPFIVALNEELRPAYMVCFDQSYHRKHRLTKEEQRDLKREFLRERGLASFYYVSHAPFLFLASQVEILRAVQERLIDVGVPESRFEPGGG